MAVRYVSKSLREVVPTGADVRSGEAIEIGEEAGIVVETETAEVVEVTVDEAITRISVISLANAVNQKVGINLAT